MEDFNLDQFKQKINDEITRLEQDKEGREGNVFKVQALKWVLEQLNNYKV